MLDEDKADACIAEYSDKSIPYALGEDKNGAVFVLTDYVFKRNKGWDSTATTNLHIINGHAFIELTAGTETIFLRMCLLDPKTKPATKYLLDQVKHPRTPEFTANAGPYEILVTVVDAEKCLVITGLNLAPLSMTLKLFKCFPKSKLNDFVSIHCPRCQENANQSEEHGK